MRDKGNEYRATVRRARVVKGNSWSLLPYSEGSGKINALWLSLRRRGGPGQGIGRDSPAEC